MMIYFLKLLRYNTFINAWKKLHPQNSFHLQRPK